MAVFEVEMHAFMKGEIRQVNVPDEEQRLAKLAVRPTLALLELIFQYGQNEYQPVPKMPSISVRDVVRLEGKRYRVDMMGWEVEENGSWAVVT